MTKKEVIAKIGKGNWKAFEDWMYGQTHGLTDDGKADYYAWDVASFEKKLATGDDRQMKGWWD